MGKTIKHKIEAKFNLGLIKMKDVPMFVRNKWKRHNNDWAEFRALKKELVEKIMNRELKNYER